MSREEVNKLYKQASAMRKRMTRRDELTKRPDLGALVLHILDIESPIGRFVEHAQGTVVWAGPQTCRVRGHGSERVAQLAGHRVAVGDVAMLGLTEDRKTWHVASLAERRTKLSRPDVGNAHIERVIVANVDIVCIVVAVVAPPLHPRIIDRYLIAIEKGGSVPMLCVNKVDLLSGGGVEGGDELDQLEPYRALGVPIHLCSTKTGAGVQNLRLSLQGRTAAFVGHSGVGKSSLMNALYPGLELDIGAVSEGYGRGTHTTTASSLHDFPGDTRLIDTPGIRSFGIGKLSPVELQWHFPEFEGVRCKFRNCSHDHEPECGVRDSVLEGTIHPARYETYLRLLRGD